MRELDRRLATKLALAAPFATPPSIAAADAPSPGAGSSTSKDHEQVAMLLYPAMTALDLVGPQYMFAALTGAKVHLVAATRDPILTDTGLTIIPTATFSETPADLTVLFVPGGARGTLAAMRDERTLAFVADRGARAQWVTSVCTGSLVLAAAGLLTGRHATSHWAARETLADFGAVPVDQRVVRDGNRLTGAGVTAGLDFGLEIIEQLRGRAYAEAVQLMCEYDPQPPFNAGSFLTAPEPARALLTAMFAGFVHEARAIAHNRHQA